MKIENFKIGLKRLSANLGKAIPIENVEIMFDELSWLPDECWEDLVSIAIGKWDTWPRNFPKAIKEIWYQWQASRRAIFDSQPCSYCNEEGLLRYNQKFDYGIYEMTCACGHCENWQKQFGQSLEWTDKPSGKKFKVKRLTVQQIREIEEIPF